MRLRADISKASSKNHRRQGREVVIDETSRRETADFSSQIARASSCKPPCGSVWLYPGEAIETVPPVSLDALHRNCSLQRGCRRNDVITGGTGNAAEYACLHFAC